MTLWLDLANSPHVLFFSPLLREFGTRGVETVVSARDFAQTLELARLHGIEVTAVGRHGGRGLAGKGAAIAGRALALRRFGRDHGASLAVSHNSYAQAAAAWSIGVPVVTIMDYEHTPANHVAFRFADRVILPRCIGIDLVRRFGARESKVVHYDGFKEQLYLDAFRPDRSVLSPALPDSLWDDFVVAVARPPADFAVYHRFENPLFERWLRRAGSDPDARVVVLPRTAEQREAIEALALPSVILPAVAVDGANLVFHADLVVSAGGTMNREAAILGVPAYSLFAGETAAVDRELERASRLTFVRSEDDLDRIRLTRKASPSRLSNPGLPSRLADLVLETALRRPEP